MSLTMLHAVLPEIAEKETRSITFTSIDPRFPNIQKGSYHFIEMFCTDEGCDCRRAMIRVIDGNRDLMATLSYAWEAPAFYSEWMGGDPDFGLETAGAKIYPMQPQGKNYLDFEKVFQWIIDSDKKYAERIRRHYNQFRMKLNSSPKIRKKLEEAYSPRP